MAAALTERTGAAGRMVLPQRLVQPDQPAAAAASPPYDELQRLVDLSANFHLRTVPVRSATAQPRGGPVTRICLEQSLHRMSIDQHKPAGGSMRASVATGGRSGSLSAELQFIAPDSVPRPGRQLPALEWDRRAACRFAVPDARVRFDSGSGFRMFGAGKVFPVCAGGRVRQMAGLVAVLVDGTGVFSGMEGNCTWVGDLDDSGWTGHIMVRIRDPHCRLITQQPFPPLAAIPDPEPGVSYLSWIGQKVSGERLANYPSLAPGGRLRGLNIPVDMKLVTTDAADLPSGFRAAALQTGDVIALEIGFGKESAPRTPEKGNPNAPFQFEGVSTYTFRDAGDGTAGAFTANVLEGRSMLVNLEGAPGQPALRFGFFGPVICGTGCFKGLRGMLYGASGSVFNLPPLDHVISNWYVLRLYDPDGRYRARPAQ